MSLLHDEQTPIVSYVSGPVVKAEPGHLLSMNEMVEVGEERLVGEVIGLDGNTATIQVYEDTTGLRPGTKVFGQRMNLFVELGPGLIGQIFDGIQRPLDFLKEKWGDFIRRGKTVAALSREKVWEFVPALEPGVQIGPGMVLGTVKETEAIVHKVLAPPGCHGTLKVIAPKGRYTLEDVIAEVEGPSGRVEKIKMFHRWPVRVPRPYRKRFMPSVPLLTGQRVIDTFFPIAKGGTAAIPGGFGTGKTVTQHQLSKWADADIIIYIGCGERGNEMTGVLTDFPRLLDPRTKRPLIERTVLIANTSDMPVAAREASIYTGITMAEYFRDQGYDVALMADSTSRWAEALREISGRLEEMPAEEGFPAYLASRLAAFYERAGRVETLSGEKGSVSLIGAVSPPGGDFSEPVTMHTKRFVQCFWALDKELASARYFPAINYLESYSAYISAVSSWWEEKTSAEWKKLRDDAVEILQEDAKLQNIVKLLGEDALPDDQRMIIEGAKLIKNDFLQQSAFDPVDTYCQPIKQYYLLKVIMHFVDRMRDVVMARIPLFRAMNLPVVEKIHRAKYSIEGEEVEPFLKILEETDQQIEELLKRSREPENEA